MQIFGIAAGGIAAANTRMVASAERTAAWNQHGGRPGAPTVDLAKEATERSAAKTALKANVAVVKTATSMTGALLDLKV